MNSLSNHYSHFAARLATIFLLILVLSGFVACRGTPTVARTAIPTLPPPATLVPSSSATAAPTSTVNIPRYKGGSIVVAGVGPASRGLTTLPRFVADALYDSLLRVNPTDGSLLPGLADRWDVSADAKTMTFHLRSGVEWQDGQVLTADDVMFTIKTLSNPSTRLVPAVDYGPLTDVSTPDAQTIIVKLSAGYCPALTNLGTLKVLPRHILQNQNLASPPDAQIIGSGPLALKSWGADSISFEANAKYWDGPVPISNWIYRVYPSLEAARAALHNGQADVLYADPASLSPAASDPDIKTTNLPANRFYSLAINGQSKVLSDAGVRQAIGYAIDGSGLARMLFGDRATVLATFVLPGFWAAPGDAGARFDQSRARQSLADAGWQNAGSGTLMKNGAPLRVTLWTTGGDEVQEPLALAVRQMLEQVGVQAIVQYDDRPGLLTRLLLQEYDLAIAPWNIPLDPDQHWYWQSSENEQGSGLNITSYASSQADSLLGQGLAAPACDLAARRTAYQSLYRTLSTDTPEVALFAPPAEFSTRSNVLGTAPSSFAGPYWNLNRWEIQP